MKRKTYKDIVLFVNEGFFSVAYTFIVYSYTKLLKVDKVREVTLKGWKKIRTQEDSAQRENCRRFGPKKIRPTYEKIRPKHEEDSAQIF